ncbi:phosphoenolpyruvate--protein phosphotransferase [Hungatella hathewayi]|jgi:phosphoenolpyruvate-protein phosphotransferase (PTS system enzyme I)|uniref:Phosphoenolpyruvate-protein phosphotransferase n=2 Tax=Hungatella hathewayi TaxID=154046 RepID=D3AGA4_9FIRM|nr:MULTISPECIES: phosphoenolpyruvate--protein phosphotransferase [Hungatella]MCD7996052.1 phosphoenolpyruvate--protein phosphotransferase [Clostridiales bacterium]EFC99151.1 phosphoenolpyruvate-protein phosphotransferase [Hungatella hathewayi DSM 13479]MBS6757557.1 phosphoenolpyruvate--protein phosphotransferase [Hungatella hathewayi]MBT9799168.1 phosphoenolpyruvate--protein phosphotransferase [Hungatella hathewayi]MCI6455646.1 phosphoenolpyruvate--protein phosphotransferase [Hungatella sp.]
MMKGTSASAGIGIGKAAIVEETELVIKKETISDAAAEKERFQAALKQAMEETEALAKDLATRVGEKEAEILNGHLMLLSDPMLTGEIENTIAGENACSEYAIENVCNMYADMFASMGDELMQQRATDMRDIKTRMQKILLGVSSVDIASLPAGSVIVAKDLTPSMTAGINPANVCGIVTELGGKTSHSAILARALEIPAVVAVEGFLNSVKDGDTVVLDGSEGVVFVNPEEAVTAEYEAKRTAYLKEKKELDQYIGKPTVTKDGVTIELVANIGKPEDVDKVLQYDAEGIGLFRTEFLFMDRNSMPTEDEQFEAYQKVAIAMNGKPVIIRTLDIGGDKEIPYMGLKKDENPFLGYRAIRFCLDRREDVYRPQLRALLRASAFGNIKIMVPMVTCLEEFREAKAMIEEIKAELDSRGIAYKKDIQVGIMVETAAASLMADAFAKEVDFFSIGTNDLTQYTMSVDRGNDKVSYLYSPLNPAVLRSIRHIIQCGRKEGIMVGMCGEAASDPLMIPLLLAFGLNEFSMSASAVLNARKLITGYSIAELQAIADKAMSFVTAGEVEAYMREQQ